MTPLDRLRRLSTPHLAHKLRVLEALTPAWVDSPEAFLRPERYLVAVRRGFYLELCRDELELRGMLEAKRGVAA